MELRKYLSAMGQWPPTWGGFYDPGDELPYGDEGGKLESVEEDESDKTLVLKVQYKGKSFSGIITIEDRARRLMLKGILDDNVGMNIKEIGRLDVLAEKFLAQN